jgi:hypothetical protein
MPMHTVMAVMNNVILLSLYGLIFDNAILAAFHKIVIVDINKQIPISNIVLMLPPVKNLAIAPETNIARIIIIVIGLPIKAISILPRLLIFSYLAISELSSTLPMLYPGVLKYGANNTSMKSNIMKPSNT